MRILESIKEKKVSRKNFIFYSGVMFAGMIMLIKMPLNLLRRKEEKGISESVSKKIRFKINPESVKRV
jgi:hypothetical protein